MQHDHLISLINQHCDYDSNWMVLFHSVIVGSHNNNNNVAGNWELWLNIKGIF